MPNDWFDVSCAGWRRLQAGRPLGELLCEGIQNSLDEPVTRLDVTVGEHQIVITDNGDRGFGDPRLIYTVFLTDKADRPDRRGRAGRGLKELLSVMDRAEVETMGVTVVFAEGGRHQLPNARSRGTELRLFRHNTPAEVNAAVAALRLVIPPRHVHMRVNGMPVVQPPLFATLTDCHLDTVITIDEAERIVNRQTAVALYATRAQDEQPRICEMGIPVAASPTPWHLDVAHRIPRQGLRHGIDASFRLQLLATLLESLVDNLLPMSVLTDPWVLEVLSQYPVSEEALRSYARRLFPPRAVLPAGAEDNERARQEGATVVDTSTMNRRLLASLSRIMETSAQFVLNRHQTAETVTALCPHEERAIAFYRYLAKSILGRPIRVRIVRRPPTPEGYVEDATFDRGTFELCLNVSGRVSLAEPLAPQALGILFHELAHAYADGHDLEFVQRLQEVAGRAAQILAEGGPQLLDRHGLRPGY